MMIAIWLSLVLWNISSNAQASADPVVQELDEALTFREWSGAALFAKKAKEKLGDPCPYFKGAETRFSGTDYMVRRVLLALAHTNCEERLELSRKYLKSGKPLLRAASIRLASGLPSPQKKKVSAEIRRLKETDQDPAVIEAVEEFKVRKATE